MKRALLILLAALFLSTSSGVSFYLHYCGKSLDGISLVGKSSCSCENGNQTSDCCRDKVHHIKIKDRFVAGHRLGPKFFQQRVLVAMCASSTQAPISFQDFRRGCFVYRFCNPPTRIKAPVVLRT